MNRPVLTPISSPRDAELAARNWMIFLGHPEAKATSGGADGGIDVSTDHHVVQVKATSGPVGRPVVQQIFGIGTLEAKRPVIFSIGGFTPAAIAWADRSKVALVSLEASGNARPINLSSRRLFDDALDNIGGWAALKKRLDGYLHSGIAVEVTSVFDLPDGYRGFWGIWLDGLGGIRVSRDFSGSRVETVRTIEEATGRISQAVAALGGSYWDLRPVITVDGDERRAERARVGLPPATRHRVSASQVYRLFSGSRCERRMYLEHRGVEGTDPSAFAMMMRELGMEHEEAHLSQFPDVRDLGELPWEERITESARLVGELNDCILYQPAFQADIRIGRRVVDVTGVPDFVIVQSGSITVRDTKVAIRVDDDRRPDIDIQLKLYGWLIAQTVGRIPDSIEILAGDGQIHEVQYGGRDVMDAVATLVSLQTADVEPACVVQWSYRGSCPYFKKCWDEATAAGSVATLQGLTGPMTEALTSSGIETIDDLLDASPERVAELPVRHGAKWQRFGRRAQTVARAARVMALGEPELIRRPELPRGTPVMFDLEGVPPMRGAAGYIYLWGTQVTGGPFVPVFADPADGGDREGWFRFLNRVRDIFSEHGPATSFIHWSAYERTQIKSYIDLYGDNQGTGSRLLASLFDLYAEVRASIVLPIPSYSLKVVEEYVGFRRSQDEFGGDWSIAIWDEVSRTDDPEERRGLLDSLATYNAEDLLGMQAVFDWIVAFDV